MPGHDGPAHLQHCSMHVVADPWPDHYSHSEVTAGLQFARLEWLGYVIYNLLAARCRVRGFACVPCLSRPTVLPTSLPTDAPSSGPTFAPTARFAHASAHEAAAFIQDVLGSCGRMNFIHPAAGPAHTKARNSHADFVQPII